MKRITHRRTFGEVLRKGGKTFPMKGEPPSSLPFQRLLCLSSFCFRHSPKRRLWEMPDVSKPKLSALSWHEVVHFRSAVKIQTFSKVFPLAGSIAKAFFRLFLWNFKEKNINHFLWHSHFYFRHSPKRRLWEMPDVSKPKLLALSWHIVALSLQYIENTNFLFAFSAGGLHAWMISLVILLELALSSI